MLLLRLKLVFRRMLQKLPFSMTLIGAMLLIVFFGTGFWWFEKDAQAITYGDALWWAMVTMTTVGYGDFYAKTMVGRFLISFPCMLMGIGFIGMTIGHVTEFMIQLANRRKRGLAAMHQENPIIICNYPSSLKVLQIARELRQHEDYQQCPVVLVTDDLEEIPEELADQRIRFIKGSPTVEEVLQRANLSEAKGVFVLARNMNSVDSDAFTFAVCSILHNMRQELPQPFQIVAEIVAYQNARMMKHSHADALIHSGNVATQLMVQEFLYPGILGVVDDLLSNAEGAQLYLHPASASIQHKFADMQIGVIRHPEKVQLLGVLRQGETLMNPPQDLFIESGDMLVFLADQQLNFTEIEQQITKH